MDNKEMKHGKKVRKRIYDFIIEYIRKYGYAPSVRNICEGVGLKSSSSVYSHLVTLNEEGKIEMRGNTSRAIKVVGYEFVKKNDKGCDKDIDTDDNI